MNSRRISLRRWLLAPALLAAAVFATGCTEDSKSTTPPAGGTDAATTTDSGGSTDTTTVTDSGGTSDTAAPADTTPPDDTGGGADTSGGPVGMKYYSGPESAALGAAGNQATCATCHSNDGTARIGNTFKDIAFHTSFKGGGAATLLAAGNACITGWMGGAALTAADTSYMELTQYRESISDTTMTTPNPIAPEVLADVAAYEAAYAGGNAAAGAAKFTATCGVCHEHALKLGAVPAPAKSVLQASTIGRLAQKARTSGPPPSGTADATDSTPGPMPFFEPSDLSADDLKDIIAHLKM